MHTDSLMIGLLYMVYRNSADRVFMPAEAKGLPREGLVADAYIVC